MNIHNIQEMLNMSISLFLDKSDPNANYGSIELF